MHPKQRGCFFSLLGWLSADYFSESNRPPASYLACRAPAIDLWPCLKWGCGVQGHPIHNWKAHCWLPNVSLWTQQISGKSYLHLYQPAKKNMKTTKVSCGSSNLTTISYPTKIARGPAMHWITPRRPKDQKSTWRLDCTSASHDFTYPHPHSTHRGQRCNGKLARLKKSRV